MTSNYFRKCDACGRLYEESDKEYMINGDNIRGICLMDTYGCVHSSRDLCDVCVEKLDKFLKGESYEPKTENEENETGAGVV